MNKPTPSVHFSSKDMEWGTPQVFYDKLNEEFKFTLDPCASHENHKCEKYFTKEVDGLVQDWKKHIVFMNPPYGRAIGEWMEKALRSSWTGATVVCLVPSRTDTGWWHRFVKDRAEIRYMKGRLKFQGAAHAAPFPSALVIYRPV